MEFLPQTIPYLGWLLIKGSDGSGEEQGGKVKSLFMYLESLPVTSSIYGKAIQHFFLVESTTLQPTPSNVHNRWHSIYWSLVYLESPILIFYY